MAAFAKTPEFSFNQKSPGEYILKAYRGVTKSVRTHLRSLLSRSPRFLYINGSKYSKKAAFQAIIKMLDNKETVRVTTFVN